MPLALTSEVKVPSVSLQCRGTWQVVPTGGSRGKHNEIVLRKCTSAAHGQRTSSASSAAATASAAAEARDEFFEPLPLLLDPRPPLRPHEPEEVVPFARLVRRLVELHAIPELLVFLLACPERDRAGVAVAAEQLQVEVGARHRLVPLVEEAREEWQVALGDTATS